MQIPDYKAEAMLRHFKRVVENATVDATDTRTVNALRLARQDLRQLEKYLLKTKNGQPI